MNGFGKVAIALRCGKADPWSMRCYAKLISRGLMPGDVILPAEIEMPHHFAAECAARRFLETDCDSVLFLDDDMDYKPEDLQTLRHDRRAYEYDAVSALYLTRSTPHAPIVFIRQDNGFARVVAPPENVLIETSFCGLGYTLIKRAVFESAKKMSGRKMMFYWGDDGQGEDANLFLDAARDGKRFAVHTGVSVGHRVPVVLRHDFATNGVSYQEADLSRLMFDIIKKGE